VAVQLTESWQMRYDPGCSPDGKHVVHWYWTSEKEGAQTIARVNIVTKEVADPGKRLAPDWPPVVFAS